VPTGTTTITAIIPDTGINGNFITSATELTIQGTVTGLNDGESVQVRIGEGDWGTATVTGNGWAFDNTANVLSEGTHVIQTRIIGNGGDIKDSASRPVEIDLTPPDSATIDSVIDAASLSQSFIMHGDTTSATELHFTGTAEAGSTITIHDFHDGDTIVATVEVDSNGNWAVTTDPLDHGTRDLHVIVTDVAGHKSDREVFSVVVDLIAPDAPQITSVEDNVGLFKGALSSGDITDDATPTFTGTAEAGSTITIKNGAVTIGTTQVKSDGVWEFTTPQLADDAYNLTITATDAAGNVSNATDFLLTINAIAPTATTSITSITPDTGNSSSDFITSNKTPTVKGTVTGLGAGEIVQVRIDSGEWATVSVNANGNWSFVAPSLTVGKHNIQTQIVNLAGNIKTGSAKEITIDAHDILRVKILGPNGEKVPLNSQLTLYDNSGKLVATKNVPNTGIVEFDNLDPAKAYSLNLSYIKDGKTINFGPPFPLGGVLPDQSSPHWFNLTIGSTATTILEARAEHNFWGEYTFAHAKVEGRFESHTEVPDVPSWYNDSYFDYVYKRTEGSYMTLGGAQRYSWKIGIKKRFSGSSHLMGTDGDDIFQANSSYNLSVSDNDLSGQRRVIKTDVYLDSALAQGYDGGSGIDIVDYSNAFQYEQRKYGNWNPSEGQSYEQGYTYQKTESNGIYVNLSYTGVQNTGFNYAQFINIEGIYGTNGDDIIWDSAADNIFEGRGGNDIFFLSNGGFDTLLYRVINGADATGGNGADSVSGFTIGMYGVKSDSDRIDLSDLLIGYQADHDGPAHWVNGVATIDAGDNIKSYLSTVSNGDSTLLYIDRDGAGSKFSSTVLVYLAGVQTDLETLLANQQIIVG